MSALVHELRSAGRRLSRRPALASFAVVTIALGVGANTAVFSLLEAVVLRPLPVAEPERLMVIDQTRPDSERGRVGYATFLDLQESTSFVALAVAAKQIDAVKIERAAGSGRRDEIVHPIDPPQERALAAAAGADE